MLLAAGDLRAAGWILLWFGETPLAGCWWLPFDGQFDGQFDWLFDWHCGTRAASATIPPPRGPIPVGEPYQWLESPTRRCNLFFV